MSDPVRLTVAYRGASADIGLRADVAEYLMQTPAPNPYDWRAADVLQAVWACLQQLKKAPKRAN